VIANEPIARQLVQVSRVHILLEDEVVGEVGILDVVGKSRSLLPVSRGREVRICEVVAELLLATLSVQIVLEPVESVLSQAKVMLQVQRREELISNLVSLPSRIPSSSGVFRLRIACVALSRY